MEAIPGPTHRRPTTPQPAVEELDSPIGRLRLSADARGLTRLSLPNDTTAPRCGAGAGEAARRHVTAAARALDEYFAGRRRHFDDLALRPSGTPFQELVWRALLEITFGRTESYGGLARRIGRPGAARAIGRANHVNPIAIVIPCHRVIGADGSLTGYGGGLQAKRWLLAHEGSECPSLFDSEPADAAAGWSAPARRTPRAQPPPPGAREIEP